MGTLFLCPLFPVFLRKCTHSLETFSSYIRILKEFTCFFTKQCRRNIFMQHHRNAKPLMKPVRYILIFACFVPLFLFRDFTPNNELKYLSIADEALRDGHLFTFWNHGTVYADKPPLYLWIVMLGKWLWGTHNLFFLSLFSIIPALWIVYIMNKWTTGNLSGKIQKSGSYMLMTSGLFTGAAIVLRMDMLMCLFIVLALYTFYKLYTGMAKTRDRFLLPLYIFLAVFSKGPVGFIVPLCSIVTFLLVKKEIRHFTRYMGWKQWCLLLGLCFLWFGAVYAEGGKSYLDNLLFHQTINRAIDSFHHQAPFWYYFTTIWYSLAPWTLFYIVVILLGLKKKTIKTDLEKLFLGTIGTTFLLLSLFSGKLDIYMLPVFPFIAYLSFLLYPNVPHKYLYFTIFLPAITFSLAFPGIFIASYHIDFPLSDYPPVYIAALILSLGGIGSLIYLFKKQLLHSANIISGSILLAILTGSFAFPKLNPYIGFGDLACETEKIGKATDINSFFFYRFRSGENIDSYLNREIKNCNSTQLSELEKTQDFILLVKNKDLKSDRELYRIVKNKEIYIIGDYSIIIFYLNK